MAIIAIVGFFYLLGRINGLEGKISKMKDESAISKPVPAAPSSHAPAPVPRSSVGEKIVEPGVTSPVAPQPLSTPATKGNNSEFEFGAKTFTAVGVLALLAGIGFFLRYAFQNDLISETARVMLGVFLGIVLCGIGMYLRRKFVVYGESLLGAGLGVLYVSAYAAYSFYHLIGSPAAFLLLCIISVAGVALSLMYDSLPLVSFSLLGAYIITLLLPLSHSIHPFFLYILVLNAIVLGVTSFKRWPQLSVFSIVATFLLLLRWLFEDYAVADQAIAFVYLAILFGGHAISTLRNFILMRKDYKALDGVLLPAVPIAYICVNFIIMQDEVARSILLFILGLLYILGSFVVRALTQSGGENIEGKACSNVMILIGGGFVAASIANHFQGTTVTYLWAVEAITLIALGVKLRESGNRIAGIVLAVLSVIHMYFLDFGILPDASPVFNPRALLSLVMFLIFTALYYSYRKAGEGSLGMSKDEYTIATRLGLLGIYFIPLIWMSSEISHFVTVHTNTYMAVGWIAYSVVMISVGFTLKETFIRFISYALLGLAILTGFFDTWNINSAHAFLFDIRIAMAAVDIIGLVAVGILIKSFKSEISPDEYNLRMGAIVVSNFIALMVGCQEISDYFNAQLSSTPNSELATVIENTKRVALSGFLLVYASVAMACGIIYRSYVARIIAFILFGCSVFKIFLYDAANFSDVYRFVSYISLGVILLVFGYAFYRFKDRIINFVQVK